MESTHINAGKWQDVVNMVRGAALQLEGISSPIDSIQLVDIDPERRCIRKALHSERDVISAFLISSPGLLAVHSWPQHIFRRVSANALPLLFPSPRPSLCYESFIGRAEAFRTNP